MCACSTNSNLTNDLDTLLNIPDLIASSHSNNTLNYFDYYLPSDMKEVSYQQDGLILKYDDSEIIANINVNDIVSGKYYQDQYLKHSSFFDNNYLVYTKSGTYTTVNDLTKDFIFNLYQNDGIYAIELITSDLIYLTSTRNNVKDIVKHLFTIARSIDLNTDLVIADYSNKNIVDYNKKQIDLFDSSKPSSGNLSQLLINDATVGDEENNEPVVEEDNSNSTSQKIIEENMGE